MISFLFLMLKYYMYFFLGIFLNFHHIQKYDLFLSAIQVCPLSSHSVIHWQHIARYVFWVHIYRIVYILYWIFLCSWRYAVSALPSSCHLSLFYKQFIAVLKCIPSRQPNIGRALDTTQQCGFTSSVQCSGDHA